MYVFGGNTLENSFQDLWRLDLDIALRTGVEHWEEIQALGEVSNGGGACGGRRVSGDVRL